MTGARILVTGARGFVGRQAVPHFPETAELHLVSRHAQPSDSRNATWHGMDLLDPSACERLVKDVQPTHLVHLAWNTEHGKFWTAPDNEQWRDAGAVLVQTFAAVGGKRLVICGTGAEYSTTAVSPLNEANAPTQAETLYGQMKNELHVEASKIALATGISFAWGRIFNAYGAFESRGRLVPSIIDAIMHGETAKCSSGQQVRDFMDVRDLGAAVAALALSKVRGPVNLGSGHQVKIADVAQTIGRLMGRPDLIALGALPDRPGEPLLQVPDLTRLRDELGFEPKISLEQGLRDAIDWWQVAAQERPVSEQV